MKSDFFRYLTFLILVISNPDSNAQDWECAKERDGIKKYWQKWTIMPTGAGKVNVIRDTIE